MTIRLVTVLVNGLLAMILFFMALAASDEQKKQTRLLYAIWFALAEIVQILGAIAHHTGAYPLWNNK